MKQMRDIIRNCIREGDFSHEKLLYVGGSFDGRIFLDEEGRLFLVGHEEGLIEKSEVRDKRLHHFYMVEASRRFRELERLAPTKGPNDSTCDLCGGTGIAAGVAASVRCQCNGTGWMPVD